MKGIRFANVIAVHFHVGFFTIFFIKRASLKVFIGRNPPGSHFFVIIMPHKKALFCHV